MLKVNNLTFMYTYCLFSNIRVAKFLFYLMVKKIRTHLHNTKFTK